MSLEEQFLKTITEKTDIKRGDRILVGVSGGIDSVVLLHLLHKYKEKLGIELIVAHINHKLRTGDSEKDQDFTAGLAEELGIHCHILREDVGAIAKANKWSIEEAARKVRYDYLSKLKAEESCSKIAVAHHMRDQAETVLMHLIRGSSTRGLKGMDYDKQDIIRPLLDADKEEIDAYAKEKGLEYRVDKSNFQTRFTRNRIRLKLLPLLKTFNPQIEKLLVKTAKIAQIEDDYLDGVVTTLYKKTAREYFRSIEFDDVVIREHKAIRNRLLIKAYEKLTGCHLEYRWLEKAEVYLSNTADKKLGLPNDVSLYIYGNSIILSKVKAKQEPYSILAEHPGNYELEGHSLGIRLLEVVVEASDYVKRGSNEGFVDFDKLRWPLVIRNRQKGDTFLAIKSNSPKKLKEIFIDKKIKTETRQILPIVEDDSGKIVFIPGIGVSDYFKIDSATSKILHFSYL